METLEQFRKAAFMYCIFNYKFNTRHIRKHFVHLARLAGFFNGFR
jgi:hypothetical protein